MRTSDSLALRYRTALPWKEFGSLGVSVCLRCHVYILEQVQYICVCVCYCVNWVSVCLGYLCAGTSMRLAQIACKCAHTGTHVCVCPHVRTLCVSVWVHIIATGRLAPLARRAQWNTSCWDAVRLLASGWTSNEAHLCLHQHQLDSPHNAMWKTPWAWQLYKHPPCLRRTWTLLSSARLCARTWVLGVSDVRACVSLSGANGDRSRPPVDELHPERERFAHRSPVLSPSLSLLLSFLTTLSYLITLSAGMCRHTGDCSVI